MPDCRDRIGTGRRQRRHQRLLEAEGLFQRALQPHDL
jgi:hypothetical protein